MAASPTYSQSLKKAQIAASALSAQSRQKAHTQQLVSRLQSARQNMDNFTKSVQQKGQNLLATSRGGPLGAPGGVATGGPFAAATDPAAAAALHAAVVALDSLKVLATELNSARGALAAAVGQARQRQVDLFYSRTVESVDDLKEFIYWSSVRRALNLEGEGGLVNRI